MSRARLILESVDFPIRSDLRSVASDWLLENEGKGHSRPVTACHIKAGGWGRWIRQVRRWEAKAK